MTRPRDWLRQIFGDSPRVAVAADNGMPPLLDLPPFRTISAETRGWLSGEMGWIAIAAGEMLFAAGDPADTLYIVITGLLGVVIATPDRGQEMVAEIRQGETIGDMALLTGEHHSSTIVALRHSELYAMPRPVFERLLDAEPQFIVWLARLLVARLHRTTFRMPEATGCESVALVPEDAQDGLEDIAHALKDQLGRLGARVALLGPDDADQKPDHLGRHSAAHDILLYRSTGGTDRWSLFCLRESSRILLVARPGSLKQDRPAQTTAFGQKPAELVLVEPDGNGRQGFAAAGSGRFQLVHRLRPDHTGDMGRLARHVAGCAVGLVLSGGAARGFAHIGAIAALREAGLAIDRSGGASMGAIIAAGIAAGWDDAELRQRMYQAFVRRNPLDDYTIPWVALYKGRSVDRLLHDHFGTTSIEALWLPFFCVSTNLSQGRIEVHRTGALAPALRASIAIPGVLPPVVLGRDVLVDGGVIDNFPVGIMQGAGRARIVGVDVAEDEALMPGSEVPPTPNLLLRLIRPRKRPELPGIVSVLSRVGTVSSRLQRTVSRAQVDLLIEPALGNVPLLDWRRFDQIVEAGRVAALRAIEALPGGLDNLAAFSRERP